MSSTDSDEDRSGTGPDQRPGVPVRVRAALAELGEQAGEVGAMPRTTAAEHAAYSARLAMIAARTAGWWGVLANHTYADHDTDSLYGRAALSARAHALTSARFWVDQAQKWQDHAEHAQAKTRSCTERDTASVTTAPAVVEDAAGEVDQ